jgi:hypothetical protein
MAAAIAAGEKAGAYVTDLPVRHERKTSFTAMVRQPRLVRSSGL